MRQQRQGTASSAQREGTTIGERSSERNWAGIIKFARKGEVGGYPLRRSGGEKCLQKGNELIPRIKNGRGIRTIRRRILQEDYDMRCRRKTDEPEGGMKKVLGLAGGREQVPTGKKNGKETIAVEGGDRQGPTDCLKPRGGKMLSLEARKACRLLGARTDRDTKREHWQCTKKRGKLL